MYRIRRGVASIFLVTVVLILIILSTFTYLYFTRYWVRLKGEIDGYDLIAVKLGSTYKVLYCLNLKGRLDIPGLNYTVRYDASKIDIDIYIGPLEYEIYLNISAINCSYIYSE